MQAQDNPAGSLRLTPRGRAYGQRSVRQQRRIGSNVPSRVRILHRASGTGCGSDVQRVAGCGALPSGGVTRKSEAAAKGDRQCEGVRRIDKT
jgi:hypothetical protein